MSNDSALHIRLEKSLKKELEKIAKEYNIKLSNLARVALEEYAYKDHEVTTTKINTDNF